MRNHRPARCPLDQGRGLQARYIGFQAPKEHSKPRWWWRGVESCYG
jgi:hypothetical protein